MKTLGGIDSKARELSAYSSSLRVELVAMASATCFAPSASSLLNPRLPTRNQSSRQGALTVGNRQREIAYVSVCNAEFDLRASDSFLMPEKSACQL